MERAGGTEAIGARPGVGVSWQSGFKRADHARLLTTGSRAGCATVLPASDRHPHGPKPRAGSVATP